MSTKERERRNIHLSNSGSVFAKVFQEKMSIQIWETLNNFLRPFLAEGMLYCDSLNISCLIVVLMKRVWKQFKDAIISATIWHRELRLFVRSLHNERVELPLRETSLNKLFILWQKVTICQEVCMTKTMKGSINYRRSNL